MGLHLLFTEYKEKLRIICIAKGKIPGRSIFEVCMPWMFAKVLEDWVSVYGWMHIYFVRHGYMPAVCISSVRAWNSLLLMTKYVWSQFDSVSIMTWFLGLHFVNLHDVARLMILLSGFWICLSVCLYISICVSYSPGRHHLCFVICLPSLNHVQPLLIVLWQTSYLFCGRTHPFLWHPPMLNPLSSSLQSTLNLLYQSPHSIVSPSSLYVLAYRLFSSSFLQCVFL